MCHGPTKDNKSNCPHSSHFLRKYLACRNNDAEKVRFVSQNLQNDHGIQMDGTDWIRAPDGTGQKKTNNFRTYKVVVSDIFDEQIYNNQKYRHRCHGCHFCVSIWEQQQVLCNDSITFRGVEHKHRNLLNDRFELQEQKCKGIYVEGDGECPNQEYLNEQSLKFPNTNLLKRLIEFIMPNLQFTHTHRRDGEEGHTRTTTIFQQQIIRLCNAPNNDDEGDVRCNECAKECTSQEDWYKLMKDNPGLLLWDDLEYFYNEHQWVFRQRPGTPKLLDVPFILGFKVGDTFEVDFNGKDYTGKLLQYDYRHVVFVDDTDEDVKDVTVPIYSIMYEPYLEIDYEVQQSKDDVIFLRSIDVNGNKIDTLIHRGDNEKWNKKDEQTYQYKPTGNEPLLVSCLREQHYKVGTKLLYYPTIDDDNDYSIDEEDNRIERSTIIRFDKDGNYHVQFDNNGETVVIIRGNMDHMTLLDNQVKLATAEAAAKQYIDHPSCVDNEMSIVELIRLAMNEIVKKK